MALYALVAEDEVRRRCATRALGASADLTEAIEHYEFWKAVGKSPVHGEICVGLGTSRWTEQDRQRASEGTLTDTDIRVALSFQLAAHDQRETADQAVVLAAAIRSRLVAQVAGSAEAPGWPAGLGIYWQNTTRTAGRESGWLYIEHTFRVLHRLPL